MSNSGRVSRVGVLVVIAVIAVVMSLLAVWIPQAREQARLANCTNNNKQIGLAMANYHDVDACFPPGCVGSLKLPPSRRWSWYIPLSPYIEGGRPGFSIDFSKASDREENLPADFDYIDNGGTQRTARFEDRAVLNCPNGEQDTDEREHRLATYVGMAGLGNAAATLPADHKHAGMWGYDRVTVLSNVPASESTIQVIETGTDRGSWYRGGPATVRPFVENSGQPIGDGGQFGGLHPGGAMTLFADGHVKFLSNMTEPAVFKSMTTIAED